MAPERGTFSSRRRTLSSQARSASKWRSHRTREEGNMKNLQIVSSAILFAASYLGAQSSAEMLSRLRALPLKEANGPVPLLYSPASEQRALRWQRSLGAAHAWFQTQ